MIASECFVVVYKKRRPKIKVMNQYLTITNRASEPINSCVQNIYYSD